MEKRTSETLEGSSVGSPDWKGLLPCSASPAGWLVLDSSSAVVGEALVA